MPTSVIPNLISGGIMLSYRCSNACRHCLYRCSPNHRDHWMSEETLNDVFSTLSNEPDLRGVHIAGGEATLNLPLLKKSLTCAQKYRVEVDYLETNCGWCDSFQKALEIFSELKDSGLNTVLVSASLFHNEFIPFCRTRDGIEAALHVFDGRVIIWTPEVFSHLSRLDHNRCHSLSESMKILKLDHKALWRMHPYLTPSGRAAETLNEGLKSFTPEEFKDDPCAKCLDATGHFHIDPHGNLYTGHCPGLSIASVKTSLHPESEQMAQYKVFTILQTQGPYGLLELSPEFKPSPNGYIHKCHFCLEMRKHLYKTRTYPELTPSDYYGEFN